MRIFWIPRGGMNLGSSRTRAYYIHEALMRRGVDSHVGLPADSVAGAPSSVTRGDVVIFQKVFDDTHVALAERFRAQGARTIFDIDDRYAASRMIAAVDAVTVDSEARRIELDDARAHVIPTPVDYGLRAPVPAPDRAGLRLVWFGSIVNAKTLAVLDEPLSRLGSDLHLAIITDAVGAHASVLIPLTVPYELCVWDQTTFSHDLMRYDVALLAQSDAAKGACRMVTAITHGLAVAGSAVSAYEEIAAATDTKKFLCTTADEWYDALCALSDPACRKKYIEHTQGYVWARYNVDVVADQWLALCMHLVEGA